MATGITLTGLEGDERHLSAEQISSLADRVKGPMLRPGEDGWDEAVLVWNGMVANQPGLVLRPMSADDVMVAVQFAAEHGILISVKGGGHNIAGTSIAPGGLTLDMSLMRGVVVDPDRMLVHVDAGCLIKHVDNATQEHGLATVLGFVSETGVAGLTLGGGIGYLSRRWGWTVDSLEKVEIVTAEGRARTASRDEDADLFWALRGGGGNYGVATCFTFRLYEVGPSITGGLIAWDAERADDVLAVYKQLTDTAPRELTAVCTVRLAPPALFIPPEWHGKPMVGMVICHTGPNAEADLAPVKAIGDPIADLVMEKTYVAQQSMLDATQPKGLHYYWKTEYVPELSEDYLATFKAGALNVTSPLSQSICFHLGGALNERPEDDGAVGNRDAAFVTGFAGCWPPPDERAGEHKAWVRASWETIRPFSSGNYVNFQVADDDAERTAEAYGANFERLQKVKAAYDPFNLFRVNRNIAPTG
ncbi:MAG: FAD-binding oxidoreductase [Acidimicrobiales bacterium]